MAEPDPTTVEPLGHDFVNRQGELSALLSQVDGPAERALFLVGGESGMGKSYLLGEALAQFRARQVVCARLDLTGEVSAGYLPFVSQLWELLGPTGFGPLVEAMTTAQRVGQWTVPAAPAANPPTAAPLSIQAQVGEIAAGAQVAVGQNNLQIQAQAVNVYYREDPMAQRQMEAQITAGLRESLRQTSQSQILVLLLDTWEEATTELRRWLSRSLLTWVLDQTLPNVLLVIAGLQEPQLPGFSRRVRRLTVSELDRDAFQEYWVKRRGLPLEVVEQIFLACDGAPLIMRLIADRWALRGASDGSGSNR